MQYVVKVDRLGGKAEIRGIGLGDERISRMEVTAQDYVSSSALPLRIPMNEDGEENRSDLVSKLKAVFISEARIKGAFLHKPKLALSTYRCRRKANKKQTRSRIPLQNLHNPKTHARPPKRRL